MNSLQKTKAPSRMQRYVLRTMIIIGLLSILNFAYWFYNNLLIGYPLLFWLLVITLLYSASRILYEWYHYWDISIPEQKPLKKQFTVDILTTYFPGEPYEMIITTLEAIQKITYPHTTYLCDEANDPYLIAICKKLGVKHVTRDNRINAKAGNINNALKQATGEICVILDPDHIPQPDFLDPILPHFVDERIGFVQIVQAYYNIYESYVAKGAAQQTFQFYGPMMMTMNSYGTVNAIGANCTFRRAALDSIGGHAPGLSEDMHTAMQLHAKGWKSVYVPEVLASGMVPSTLTAYYKQQLKWSRGTLDLLCHVYPKLFTKFNWRQKIHYGLLPLHYLIGIIYLINFLIPIVSLMMAEMPWKGNILFFGIINLPIIVSTLLIRSYVQRWVMNEQERGFHLVGGLLQISAWWVFLLGFVYTVIGKKIPYLPTTKDGSDKSTWQILAPNVIIGLLSISAIIYGLSIDLTPFSIFMSGFALLNAFFMFFTIYLSRHVHTNIDTIKGIKRIFSASVLRSKKVFWGFRHQIYRISRVVALPLLLIVVVCSAFAIQWIDHAKWEGINTTVMQEKPTHYLGIFSPQRQGGLTQLKEVTTIEETSGIHFDIISLYLAWGDKSLSDFPDKLVNTIYDKQAVPLITWEPWSSGFKIAKEHEALKNEKKIFKHIASGHYDEYITRFAAKLKSYSKPIFLRFAHEFDNPTYPWSIKGENTATEFIAAWRHVHTLFEKSNAHNVTWVWNPWKANAIDNYYPGEAYVDWVGITGLNYSTLNADKKWYSFEQLYAPFRKNLKHIKAHPVMIAEFGSLKTGGNQQQWITDALNTIETKFPEVRSVVFFNSKIDSNVPDSPLQEQYIDWSISDFSDIKNAIAFQKPPAYLFENLTQINPDSNPNQSKKEIIKGIKGVNYKKGQHWYNDYYTLTRKYLEQDFNTMKTLGVTTIKYQGSDIYDYNILHIAPAFDIDIAYSFWIPETLDFIRDKKQLYKLSQKILKTIHDYQDKSQIKSWHISNPIWDKLEKRYDQPVATYQQYAYTAWLKTLLATIRKIDQKRPVIVDLELNEVTIQTAKFILDRNPAITAFGLVIHDNTYLKRFQNEAIEANIGYIYSDVDHENLTKTATNNNKSLYLRNWQDQLESNKISFDGLLDHNGNYKTGYLEAYNLWNNGEAKKVKLPKIRILKPLEITNPGAKLTYYAVLDLEEGWKYPDPKTNDLIFEWSLVKNDNHGNPLAIKPLGKGLQISFIIPENDKNYQLHLSVLKGKYVVTTNTSLNTPLSSEEKNVQH